MLYEINSIMTVKIVESDQFFPQNSNNYTISLSLRATETSPVTSLNGMMVDVVSVFMLAICTYVFLYKYVVLPTNIEGS